MCAFVGIFVTRLKLVRDKDGITTILINCLQKIAVGSAFSAAVLGFNGEAALALGVSKIGIAPHRAVYEISLLRASPGSGIANMKGRMVYEVSGGRCSGYSQKMRFVTRITDHDGSEHINDLRSTSLEGGEGDTLKFNLVQYRDDSLTDATEGNAGRDGNGSTITVDLIKPQRKGLRIDGSAYFPMQHTRALMDAARSGRDRLEASVYDGSDNGNKVYYTNAVIGEEFGRGTVQPLDRVSVDARLQNLRAWPVSISYFEPKGAVLDELPSYEISFRFLENGISTRLSIDYGDFALKGRLERLQLLDKSSCEGNLDGDKVVPQP